MNAKQRRTKKRRFNALIANVKKGIKEYESRDRNKWHWILSPEVGVSGGQKTRVHLFHQAVAIHNSFFQAI